MKIQLNTDHNIDGGEDMIRRAEEVVNNTMSHLAEHITRVELHLSDENSDKGGGRDKRCLIEARMEGHRPIAVADEAETIDQAIVGAADKLKSTLEHTLGRLSNHEDRKHATPDEARDPAGHLEG